MKRSQRLLSALLCVVLVLSLSLPAAAEGEPTLAVTTYDSVTCPGSYVTVYLYLRQPGGVGALDFDLHYDPDVLTQDSYSVDGTVYSSVNTQTPGLLRCSILSMEGLQEDLQLMTVSFRVAEDAAPGESAITLSIGDAHRASDLAEMTLLAENGSIRIREPEVSPPSMYVYGSASPETLQQGDTTDLTFSAWNMSGFASGVFDLTYDDTRFAFDSITLGDALTTGKELFSVNSDNPGLVRLTYASETAVQDGTLFTLRLRAIADVTAQTEVRLAGTDLYTEDLAAMQNAETSVWLNLEQLPPPPEDLPDLRILAPERVVPNERFDLILELEGTSAVAAGDFTLTYDPALFEITAEPAAAPELSGVGMVMVNPKYADGTVRFSFICEDGLTADQKVLVIPMRTVGSVGETGTFSASGRGLVDADYHTVTLDFPEAETLIFCEHAETRTENAVEPTCMEPGCTGDKICLACGGIVEFSRDLPALGHNYETVVTEPTCTERGYTTYTCTRCGDSYVDEYTDPLGHDYEAVVTEPTCTEQGYTTYTCKNCGDSYVDSYVNALGHDYKDVVTDPTCTEQGYTTHTCSRCGDSYVNDYTGPLGHDAVLRDAAEPTCTEDGYTGDQVCQICGETIETGSVIPALGHDYEVTVTPPTCTEQGFTTHACKRCDHSFVDSYVDALGHDTVLRDAAEPTCTEDGYTGDQVCQICGETIETGSVIPAEGHRWSDWNVTTPATEDRDGLETRSCEVCGETETRTVPKLTHTHALTAVSKVEATCTENGTEAYWKCEKCGRLYLDADATNEIMDPVVIPALGHDYEVTVTPPTCTEQGYTTHACKRCDHSFVDSYVDALGHDYKDIVTAPTCTEKGFTTHTCTRCGDSYVDSYVDALGHTIELRGEKDATCTEPGYTGDQYCSACHELLETGSEIPALGHDYKDTVTAPTCTEKGFTTHTCTRCGDSYVDSYVDALGHKTELRGAKDATCTEPGYTGDQFCTVCQQTIETGKVIPALGHDYKDTVTAPTCTEKGYATHTCSRCGDSYVDAYVDALGHKTDRRGATEPTCTEPGHTWEIYCTVCGAIIEAGEEIPALGHDYKDTVTAPTCTEKGYTTHTCARCNDTYVDAYTDALGHDYKDTVTAPTCTEKGYTTHTCSRCGDSHVDTYTDALGHDYKAVVTDPTCTEKGYTTHTCSRCSDSYVDTYTNALGHKLQTRGAKAATCTAVGYTGDQVCSVCGKTVTRGKTIPAKGHSWSAWKVTKPATETAEGAETRTCSACGKTETRAIQKLPKQTPNNPFVDVKTGQYYFDAVLWAVANGITDGTSATTFSPDATCTRGQVVTFLWRAAGEPQPSSKANPFRDVRQGDYFYTAVLWAVERGITDGTSDTTFSPHDPCTRAHVVTFLWRAKGKPAAGGANPFRDVPAGQYYYDAVLWAVSRKITDGTSATTFSPNNPCTRGQIVTFLYRDQNP